MEHALCVSPLRKFGRNTAVAVLLATTACGLGGVILPGEAAAQNVQETRFDIPAGPLSAALSAFGAQSGTQLSYDAAITRGQRSAGASGTMSREAALTRILQGSGLRYTFSGARSVVILPPSVATGAGAAPDGTVVLDTVTLRAGNGTTEGSGTYSTDTASIARGADSLREVPQSVTVVTDQALKDQNLTTIGEAMAKTSGIVATTDDLGNPVFRSRGFVIENYQIDNLGTSFESYRPDFDMAIYDRVEVLRGAEGLFSGAGEPGGSINLARKRPTDQVQSALSLSYGSWNNRRVEADIGGPIGLDGRLRGRMIGVWQDRDFFYKPSDQKKQVLYGILEYDLTPDTTIGAGVSYQHQNGTNWQTGLPTFSDGAQLGLPRDVALTQDWAKRVSTIREVFLTAEHRFNDDWSLKFSAMKQKYDFDYLNLNVGGPVDPATGIFGLPYVSAEDDGNHSKGADLSVSGRFRAWGVDYKLTAGTDWRMSDGKQMRVTYRSAFPNGTLEIDDFPGLVLPAPTYVGLNHGWPAYGAKQQGVYARLDMQTSDRMHVIVGGRYGNYSHREIYNLYDENGNITQHDTSFHWRDTGIFTPYAALTYDVTPEWTAYASVTEIYKPQGNRYAGPPDSPTQLDPITGRNFELGAKGAVMGGALNVSAALYRIERKGDAVKDLRYGQDSPFYLPLGEIVSQGLELEASGELSPGWQIYAGYTWNQNKNKQGDTPFSEVTPKHIFKLWTDYNLPGDYAKWTVGGGVTVKSRHANSGTYWQQTDAGWIQPSFEIRQGGYSVWDAHVNYRIDDRWNLALNVNNVFDKNYYATLGTPSGGNWYGEPRSATLTLRGQF